MTTANEIIDRTYNEYLYPGGDGLPEWDTLAAQLAAGATSLTTNGLVTYTPKTVIEIDYELILTREAETTTTVDLNERGYRETIDALHASGTKIFMDQTFPKLQVYNALASVIEGLFPAIYKRNLSSSLTWSWQPFDAPTGTKRIISMRVKNGTQYSRPLVEGQDYDLMHEFSPPKVQSYGGPFYEGAEVRLAYASDFTPLNSDPTNVTSGAAADLTSYCGVPASLVPHLPMAVAGHMLRGRELTRVQIDEIRARLSAEQTPVGAHVSLAEQLINTFEAKYVGRERAKLTEQDGVRITY